MHVHAYPFEEKVLSDLVAQIGTVTTGKLKYRTDGNFWWPPETFSANRNQNLYLYLGCVGIKRLFHYFTYIGVSFAHTKFKFYSLQYILYCMLVTKISSTAVAA